MTELNGGTEENSKTFGLSDLNPGLSIVDQSQEFTQGSMSCPTRNDIMHDSLLQGVKKRKVTTPVVKSGYNKRVKALDSTGNYPSVMNFLKPKSPEESPTNSKCGEVGVGTEALLEESVADAIAALEDLPPSMTPLRAPGDNIREIDPEEFLRLRGECIDLEQRLCQSQDELQLERERWHRIAEDFSSKLTRASKTITHLLVEQAKREFVDMRKRLIANQERLGRFVNAGTHLNGGRGGYWEGGTEEEAIAAALNELELDRAEVEREKAATRKWKKTAVVWSNNNSNSAAKENNAPSASSNVNGVMMEVSGSSSAVSAYSEMEHMLIDTKESIAAAETIAKRAEEQIRERQRKLHADRISYMKQLKTYRAQEESTFNNYPRLGQMERYQLLNMLGKGGFSEVYKAYDLITHCFVAVKIHEIRKDMDEAQRQNYVKHTTQEFRIHKTLKHRRIVRLLDHFAIDAMSFGVALEFVEGTDLDTYVD